MPDPVDEVLLRKDEFQSVLFRVFGQLASRFCGATVEFDEDARVSNR